MIRASVFLIRSSTEVRSFLGEGHRSNTEQKDHREKAYDDLFVFAITM
jgi:hypothetical protein